MASRRPRFGGGAAYGGGEGGASNYPQNTGFNGGLSPQNSDRSTRQPRRSAFQSTQPPNARYTEDNGGFSRESRPSNFSPAFATPCTIVAEIRDNSISPQSVLYEFLESSSEIPHQDPVKPLEQGLHLLTFGMSIRDALAVLSTPYANLETEPQVWLSLLRFSGPKDAPRALTPHQSQLLELFVRDEERTTIDLSGLPLKEPELFPWSLHDEPEYLSALVSSLMHPRFLRISFLCMSHVSLTDLGPLYPLKGIIQGLDVSYNQIATVAGNCKVLSSFTRLEEVNLIGNPCSRDINYADKLVALNRSIKTVDGRTLENLAIFQQLEPVVVDELDSPLLVPESESRSIVLEFVNAFLSSFDADRHTEGASLDSVYQSDATFSIHYISRGGDVKRDFAPIAMRRNIAGVVRLLPPSSHDLSSVVLQDALELIPGTLTLLQFDAMCHWDTQTPGDGGRSARNFARAVASSADASSTPSAAHGIFYKRTLLISSTPVEASPWKFSIVNDQIQTYCDETEYNVIFESALRRIGVLEIPLNAEQHHSIEHGAQEEQYGRFNNDQGPSPSNDGRPARYLRASANMPRQWNPQQENSQQGGFRSRGRGRGTPRGSGRPAPHQTHRQQPQTNRQQSQSHYSPSTRGSSQSRPPRRFG